MLQVCCSDLGRLPKQLAVTVTGPKGGGACRLGMPHTIELQLRGLAILTPLLLSCM